MVQVAEILISRAIDVVVGVCICTVWMAAVVYIRIWRWIWAGATTIAIAVHRAASGVHVTRIRGL